MLHAIDGLLRRAPVIPVLTIADDTDVVALAAALAGGGLPVIEVTLRTGAALAAIRRLRADLPDAIVGAGTVTDPAGHAAAVRAGARFVVSPGFGEALGEAARARPDIPFLPGVATASEVMAARRHGFRHLKFFPAGAMGGPATLKALAGPFPDVAFCPTGGIDAGNAAEYLALANVICVGGSWPAPAGAVAAGDWPRIRALAAAAAALGRR
jgi:2-dehydro-3-deoxyphosphogluconate aldolase / (4S)-4-hydroxy-2-oxoglutarate aldolase